MYRGNDNFENTLQYIEEQLYPLNYNNSDDFNILKMKLWVLDGTIREEEKTDGVTPDQDVTQPMNHWETLLNDLVYLDRYIRTIEEELDEREDDFYQLWERRLQQKARFLNTIKDEEEGTTYEDWEQPYNQRPTLLEQLDFEHLYGLFQEKRDGGEWETATDIVGKVVKYCIDIESFRAEQNVLNHVDSAELEAQLLIRAEENIELNDRNYVNEMRDLHDELLSIIQSTDTIIVLDEFGEEEEVATGTVLLSLPTKREVPSLVDDSNHMEVIIETGGLQTGGYRFEYRNSSGALTDLSYVDNLNEDAAWNEIGELEDTWENVSWGDVIDVVSGETTTTELVHVEYVRSLLPSTTGTEFTIGADTLERFDTLNERWININNLREYQISNTGTRIIIESMVTATIPDLLNDKISHFVDKREQKQLYTESLKERREEFN